MNKTEYWVVAVLGIVLLGIVAWVIFSEQSPLSHAQTGFLPGVVQTVEGSVEVSRGNSEIWRNGAAGDTLQIGDRIRTRKQGKAVLAFGNLAFARISDGFLGLVELEAGFSDQKHVSVDLHQYDIRLLVPDVGNPVED